MHISFYRVEPEITPANVSSRQATGERLTIARPFFLKAKVIALDVLAIASAALLICTAAAGIGAGAFFVMLLLIG